MQPQAPASVIDAPADTLFQHTKRPEWGMALCVERNDHKWSLQFADGKMRKLGVEYLHLIEALVMPLDERDQAVQSLSLAAGLSLARKSGSAGRTLVSFEQQLMVFAQLYPDGFVGDAWTKEMRGGSKRPIKRHRDPAVAMAQELLGVDALTQLVADGYWSEVITRMQNVLQKTSLISKKQLTPLASMPPEQQQELATALLTMLKAPGRDRRTHIRFITALNATEKASWPLATALLALLRPDLHVCAAPATFRKQAQWMAPDLRLTNVPDARIYQSLAGMVDAVQEKLVEAGLAPRDLLDVTDFMAVSLRPANLKGLANMKAGGASDTEMSLESKAEGAQTETTADGVAEAA